MTERGVVAAGHPLTASSGADVLRSDVSAEAVRLTRQLHDAAPDAPGETTGLLARMLLTEARRSARADAG